MIITILIGNNVVNIAAASIATLIATDKFSSSSIGIITGLLTFFILVFGEITPKTFATKYAGTIALLIARVIEALKYVLYPFVVFLDWLTNAIGGLVKIKKFEPITEAEIKTMIEFGVEKNVVAPEEQYIINRALAFSDTKVKEVMIPMKNVFALESGTALPASLDKIISSGFSRIPIFKGDKKNIIGIALVKDVAREAASDWSHESLKDIAMDPIVVPQDMRIDYLFKLFQKKHRHFAVVKENGNQAVGIVTLEDLIEELVGEIVDESDVVTD